jgi:hypothetical protein
VRPPGSKIDGRAGAALGRLDTGTRASRRSAMIASVRKKDGMSRDLLSSSAEDSRR